MGRAWRISAGITTAAVMLMAAGCQSSGPLGGEHDVMGEQAWSLLQTQVGQYPPQAPYLQQGMLAAKMQHLLGDHVPAFLANLEVAAPLQQEGHVYYITGNRPHDGGHNAAAIALDAQSQTMRIWWLQNGQPRVVQDPGAAFAWPKDVNQMINNVVASPAP